MHTSSLDYNLRDNVWHNWWGYKLFNDDHITPGPTNKTSKEALFVTVTDKEIRLQRLEFLNSVESLGPDWVMPVDTAIRPYAFVSRKATRTPPRFPTNAAVTVTREQLKPYHGKEKVPALRVTFNQAEPVGDCRVFEYEVTPILCEDDVELPLKAKRVLAPGFNLPIARATLEKGFCCFALSDFPPKGHLRFEVRALECFGLKSAPIFADFAP